MDLTLPFPGAFKAPRDDGEGDALRPLDWGSLLARLGPEPGRSDDHEGCIELLALDLGMLRDEVLRRQTRDEAPDDTFALCRATRFGEAGFVIEREQQPLHPTIA